MHPYAGTTSSLRVSEIACVRAWLQLNVMYNNKNALKLPAEVNSGKLVSRYIRQLFLNYRVEHN